MRTLIAFVGLGLAGMVASASADQLETARGQPLTEVSHAVEVAVADGIATYKVQRVFANAGTVADEVRLEIDLPYGAAATGLRIRARERWYEGELMEAEQAARLYQELTGRGVWKPKDPALLYWRWADKLALQIFPVMPGGTSTVEYTLTVPTRYQGGKVFLSYPRLGVDADPALAIPVFTIRPGWGDATTRVAVDGLRRAPGVPIVLARAAEPAWLAALAHDDAASYVASSLTVDDARAAGGFDHATVVIDLEHTYRGDLEVTLVTPAGHSVAVVARDGGGDNDVRGRFPVALPPGTDGRGTWRLVVSDHAALDTGTLTAWSLELGDGPVTTAAADLPLYIPDAPENAADGGVATIELAPPPIDGVAARLGRVVASAEHGFSRLEVDAAPELRPLPTKAQVVFVIDASRSQGADGIAGQLAIVRAYLAHVPDARVEVVLYRRTATALFGGFIPATQVPGRLALAARAGLLAPGNGSALDAGAALAARLLATRTGAQRMVITTDDLLRSTYTNQLALAALAPTPAGAVVHVVEAQLAGGQVTVARDDGHGLAPLALAHHGIAAVVAGLADADKHLAAQLLGLVRPVRIDHFAVDGLDVDAVADDYRASQADSLDEGAGRRLVFATARPPATVELTGMIWGDRFRRVVTVDARFSRAAAAWVFSEDDHHDLSEAEMMTVAMMGRAVSPVTSYLATEPGVRPSTIGFERTGTGAGFGSGSGALASVRGGVVRVRPEPMRLLAGARDRCVAAVAPAAGWQVTLTLETTYAEVVDVVPAAASPMASCLAEAVWALDLGADYWMQRASFPLTFE
ncbi:MAG: proprotein convertase P-domain-containing protein [Kofleriaceae bacterium]